jgi:hypothetical protein
MLVKLTLGRSHFLFFSFAFPSFFFKPSTFNCSPFKKKKLTCALKKTRRKSKRNQTGVLTHFSFLLCQEIAEKKAKQKYYKGI